MIQQVSAYKVGEQVFPTIQEAQRRELVSLLCGDAVVPEQIPVIDAIIKHTDEVVAILTCQPKTKKPRSDKGKSHAKKTTPEASSAN